MNPAELQDLASAWWGWIVPVSVRAGLVALVVLGIERLGGRRLRPAASAALWGVVGLELLLPPDLGASIRVATVEAPGLLAGRAPVLAGPSAGSGWILGAFVLWLSGLLLLLAVGASRYRRQASTLLEASRPAIQGPRGEQVIALAIRCARRVGLRRLPALQVSTAASGPLVVGILRPTVILPIGLAADTGSGRLEHVLLHELAHVARRDPARSLGCLALQLLFWFHPGAWWMRARLATLREVACDRRVARALEGRVHGYRATLLELARPLIEGDPRIGLAFRARRGSLLRRLDALERVEREGLRRAPAQLVAGGILCAVLILSGLRPAPSLPLEVPGLPGFELPELAETRGCLQLRYTVLGRLAAERAAGR